MSGFIFGRLLSQKNPKVVTNVIREIVKQFGEVKKIKGKDTWIFGSIDPCKHRICAADILAHYNVARSNLFFHSNLFTKYTI